MTKYIGTLYYRLPTVDDPESVLYHGISGLRSLDGMGTDFVPPAESTTR
jgi:hypothetical protein